MRAPPAAPGAGTGITGTADGARWVVAGALTFANAGPLLAGARALPPPTTGVVECSGIAAVDSAALALLLAVKRGAAAQGVTLVFSGVPEALASLASLYGVEAILGG